MEQQTGSKLEKEYVKAVYCHPAYLTYMQSTSCETPGWMKHKLESRLWGKISIISDMQITPPLWQKWRGIKKPFLKVKEESEKAGLKLNIQKMKTMACSPITSWQIDGKTMESVWDFIFLGSEITVDSDCSHEIKRRLLLGRKAMTNLLLLLLSCFSHVRLCATPWTAAHQAPLSLGFSRQEHWSGLPFPSPMHESEKWKWSRSVMSDSVRPHGLQPTRLLHPWEFPGRSTGVGCHCLLRSYI